MVLLYTYNMAVLISFGDVKAFRLTDMKGSVHISGGDDCVDMTQKIWPKKQTTIFWPFYRCSFQSLRERMCICSRIVTLWMRGE